MNKLLKFVIDRILLDSAVSVPDGCRSNAFVSLISLRLSRPQYTHLHSLNGQPDYSKTVANAIDLKGIDKKVDAKAYNTTECFLNDIKWIIHNCSIVYPRKPLP